ncbi:respiratory supercomplex factor 1, mitochondrial [Plakobranchus ocellatus]|uniref:Respiratory supercomplex factor 1, mitochondrial n=1 Tax=Plakobranchus ocellatus TaxID=259542 RepID=A0AAV4AT27_9GAST|nr:respiratory supercomplex factor 1, mitochondrial [Plakobranchus ocellatus]
MGNPNSETNAHGSDKELQQESKPSPKHKLTIEELSYLPPPAPFYVQQGLREKLISKCKENPFVPIGVVFTTVVLGIGLGTLASEKHRKKAQLMMRLRVGGQAFAIFAVLAGVYYNTKMAKKD